MIKKSLWILVALIGISSSVFAQQKQTKKTGQQTASTSSAAVEQKTDTVYIIRQSQQLQPKNYVYCELFGEIKQSFKISKKMVVKVNFGQKRKASIVLGGGVGADFGDYITGEDGKKIEFNSMIDALNLMGLQGWEFVQTYKTDVTGKRGEQLIYLLKKEITPEEKAQMEEDLKKDE